MAFVWEELRFLTTHSGHCNAGPQMESVGLLPTIGLLLHEGQVLAVGWGLGVVQGDKRKYLRKSSNQGRKAKRTTCDRCSSKSTGISPAQCSNCIWSRPRKCF
ncbi:unnamed protein product [Rangifer tarandus platyrhynchus]|uniref:Uncharacterized protein n=2 Tax=Rangifer tarandus platyrhynchus TaxID=3082113 RepID=A0ABN8ZP39_RANTA|nr:unnamed protein product [Rangifer tarandus platyrhynchus]